MLPLLDPQSRGRDVDEDIGCCSAEDHCAGKNYSKQTLEKHNMLSFRGFTRLGACAVHVRYHMQTLDAPSYDKAAIGRNCTQVQHFVSLPHGIDSGKAPGSGAERAGLPLDDGNRKHGDDA
jgi:hypothetical protein